MNSDLRMLDGTVAIDSYGERAVFYNPNGKLKRGVYILTINEKDGQNDKYSRMNRNGIFRTDIGPLKAAFVKLFGSLPARPAKGAIVAMDFDFAAPDRLLPHPACA